jgi:transposase
MGKVTRKRYSAEFKAKVALEAIKGEQTLAQLAAKYEVHHVMIATWKKQAIEGMASTFSGKSDASQAAQESDIEKLHAKIGQLIVERYFLQRASARLGLGRGGK